MNVDVEQPVLDQIEELAPPRDHRAAHVELVASWQQRIAALESVYQRLDPAGEAVPGDLRRTDEPAVRISDIAESLETTGCGFEPPEQAA